MDDLIGFMLGIGAFVVLLMLAMYVLIFLFLAAMVLVPCFFLGRQFYRQLTHKYRLTCVSTLVLFLVGVSSVMGALGLVHIMQEPQGYSYVLMGPLFLCMATATLALWGLIKAVPFWRAILKAEKVRSNGQAEIRGVELAIARLSRKTETLKKEHESLLEKRKEMTGRVRELCTQAGDQRMRTLLKERLESEYEKLSLNDIKERIDNLKGVSDKKEENELKKSLLDIALIDARTGNAQASLRDKEERIAAWRKNKQQLEQIDKKVEQEVQYARAALRDFKVKKIILD